MENDDKKKSLLYVSLQDLIKIVIIPISIVYILSNIMIMKYALNDTINSNKSVLAQISERINSDLENISLVTANIASTPKLYTCINQWDQTEDGYEKSKIESDIDELISAKLNYLSLYECVVVNLKNGDKYTYGSTTTSEFIESSFKDDKYIRNRVNIITDYIGDKKIALVIPVSNKATVVDNIVVVINESLFNHNGISDGTSLRDIYIRIQLGSSKFKGERFSEGGKIYYYDMSKIERFGLYIIAKNELTATIRLVVRLIITGIVGAIIIILTLFIYYGGYKNKILNPIGITVNKIRRMRKSGKFNEVFEDNNIKEINSLNTYLNSMIRKVNRLMKENTKINDEKLALEISALQSQITPHFIFNTLNSIRIQAVINEDIEVANNIKSFSTLIKGNFTKGNIHSFEEESKYIESYFAIMKLRYGENIKINMSIEDEVRNKKLLKLIIQPIIENSITHGFISNNYEGEIVIKAYTCCNKIKVEIIDNGVGITEEKSLEILSGDGEGIGVYNTDRRIKVYYGKEYGVEIESEVNKYTKMTITLPIIEESNMIKVDK